MAGRGVVLETWTAQRLSVSFLIFDFFAFFVGLLDYNAIPNSNGKSVSYIAALVALSVDQSITSNIASSIAPSLLLCIAVHVPNVPIFLFIDHRYLA